MTQKIDGWLRLDSHNFKRIEVDPNKFHETMPPGAYDMLTDMEGNLIFHREKITSEPLLNTGTVITPVINEFDIFMNAREKYELYGLPHKRGLLLHGPAGTGKSCIARMIMTEIIKQRGICLVAETDTLGLVEAAYDEIRSAQPDTPIVVLIEDIDVFDGNMGLRRLLTNILDGLSDLRNIMFVGTTNYFDKLSPQLTRPSRFDSLVEIGPADSRTRKQYFESLVLGDESVAMWEVHTDGFTFAQMKELFICVHILGLHFDVALHRLGATKKLTAVEA